MKTVLGILISLLLFSTPVKASELVESDENNDQSVSSGDSTVEYILEFPESIATYDVNEDDYNFNEVSTFAVGGDVYAGSYNSTIITLWNGLLNNNVGKDYVAWRSSQYEYYIFFGEDFESSGTGFAGSGTYYYLNTYNNGYGYTSGTDSFSIDASSGYLYTNISPDYPSLENDRGLIYEQIQTVLFIAMFGIIALRWIFINK